MNRISFKYVFLIFPSSNLITIVLFDFCGVLLQLFHSCFETVRIVFFDMDEFGQNVGGREIKGT